MKLIKIEQKGRKKLEIKLEDIKATLVRLQGQIDVWQALYQEAEKIEAKRNEPATESK